MKKLLILCRVVDNYGDIGFVYRLLRSLYEINFPFDVTLAVSDMVSFSRMCPQIDCNAELQKLNGWNVIHWDGEFPEKFIKENIPDIIFECFQCGRPDWLEELLFDESFTKPVEIINIEYLTAEEWADEFHLLKSGTRKSNIKKINFMPGFTDKTAGLVLDSEFVRNLKDREYALNKMRSVTKEKTSLFNNPDVFTVSFFSYEKDCSSLTAAIEKFTELRKKENPDFELYVFSPEGKSYDSFYVSWKNKERNFSLVSLPYMNQLTWDAFLSLCSVNMIRGEDSFSRAALSSLPFLWHAYIQDGEFQLVKVKALLKRMKPFFSEENYLLYLKLMLYYNRTVSVQKESLCDEVVELFEEEKLPSDFSDAELEKLFLEFFMHYEEIKKSFSDFSDSLFKNENLSEQLKALCFKLSGE